MTAEEMAAWDEYLERTSGFDEARDAALADDDEIGVLTAEMLLRAPRAPHIDRLPAHAFDCGASEWHAESFCAACLVIFEAEHIHDDEGND